MGRSIKFRAWDKIKRVMFEIFDSESQKDWFLPAWKDNYEVMQYTGLKDKNEKEIYEGDIIPNSFNKKCIVVFENGRFIARGKGFYIIPDYFWNSEIIGNIYENPELLN